jgi:guanine nucleotide-binding protein subunit alpha
MKIINLNGYSEDELYAWRATVYRNVVESAQTLVQAVHSQGLLFERKELNVSLV